MIRGEVAAWCLVMSCTCWGPWGHTEVQSIQKNPVAHLLGLIGWKGFWLVTGGEMMLVSEP